MSQVKPSARIAIDFYPDADQMRDHYPTREAFLLEAFSDLVTQIDSGKTSGFLILANKCVASFAFLEGSSLK